MIPPSREPTKPDPADIDTDSASADELTVVAAGNSTQKTPGGWWVRVGCLGDLVTAAWSVDSMAMPTATADQVLVRTSRGVELAEVVGEVSQVTSDDLERPVSEPRASVTILRHTTANDQRLIDRLSIHRVEAVEACREAIVASGSDAVLLDVDHLFDGGTLLLHFLGRIPDSVDAMTGDIVSRYESIVRTREFAALLESGCGTGCGTADSAGCDDTGSGCVSCAVRGACATS